MKRHVAIQMILAKGQGSLFIHANGMISREAFTERDLEESFYMIGSMGLASSIGLGVALSQPNRRVVVVDGDGNVLTNLGALTMIGHYRPKNFLHIVLDNESYASTGGQRTISDSVALEKIAAASRFEHALACTDELELPAALDFLHGKHGPSFLLVKVEKGNLAEIGRVTHPPDKITQRFKHAIRISSHKSISSYELSSEELTI